MLEPGYELDKAIAEACGIEHELRGGEVWINLNGSVGFPFRFEPSADWNDAMFAAKKCGLFSDNRCCLHLDDGVWYIVEMYEADMPHKPELHGCGMWWPSGPCLGSDARPCVAICAAIFALKKAEAKTQ